MVVFVNQITPYENTSMLTICPSLDE